VQNLSIIIITLNEERNIDRCLKSVKGLTDDIIVVDSFSTDNTQTICEKHGAKFVQAKWLGYSDTKNFANSIAKYDWILSLDADEALSEELKRSITDALLKKNMKPYRINRLTNYCGSWIKHGAWYPDYKLRIFNRTQSKWQGYIHESISGIDEQYTEILNGDCFHYTYYTIEEHVKQTEKFSRMRAEEMFHEEKKVSFLKMIFAPCFRFFRDYFLKLGFLDGTAGYRVARISAKAVYLKYYYLRQFYKTV
jgi:glycosyltransferase involved in cell wall biosynthesis